MKILLSFITLLTLSTSFAQNNPEPISTIDLDQLIYVQCDEYLTHITRESCITEFTSCIFNRLATRSPIFMPYSERMIHSYLYCSKQL